MNHLFALRLRAILTLILGVFLFVFFSAADALAASDVPSPQPGLALPSIQFWTIVVGTLVPLLTYMINHHAPWATEPAKAVVLVVASATAGALYQLIQAGNLAFDTETLQVVFSAVVAALGAHKLLWAPSGISAKLGGGSNAGKS